MTEILYNIYKLKNYFNTTEFFEKDLKKYRDAKFQGTITQVVEKLKKNEGWHIRINPEKPCIFYVDFDKTTKERFVKLLKLLCDHLEFKPDDISYTRSKTIDGKYSYHISIPSMWTDTPLNIKRYFEHYDCYKEFLTTKEIDVSVYSVKPYRLPMQTNDEKPIQHKIIQGTLQDFITEYTDKATDYLEPVPEKVYVNNYIDEEVSEEDVHKCLECIDPDCGYEDWIKVATAVKNLTSDFDIWNDWSKQSSKYNAKEMKIKWKSFNNTDIGIACLKSLARQYNEELYVQNFPKPEVNVEFIDNDEQPQPQAPVNNLCVSIHEQDIGQYIIDTYLKDSYVCVSLEDNTFFYYNNNRWIEDKGNITLFKYITKDYLKDVVKYQNEAQTKVNKLKDDDKEKAILVNKLKNVCKLLAKLKGKLCNFEGVVDWIAKELYNPKFYDLCDENICLLGFDNGVYDTKTKTFRDGKPSDYVTKSVGYNFPIDDKGYRKDIDEFLKKVFPDKELRKYVLHQQAQALSGMKGNDCVYTHSGKGSNGKSIEQILLTNVFGDYFLEIPSTMLTKVNKMEHNKPDPFYTEMKGVRYSIANEPSDGSKINDSLIKIMGSKEGLKFRTLFSKVVEKLKLQTQLHIYCNNKLDFNANDGGVVRRLKVIDYVSKFSEDNNLINEANNIYSMDTELSEKVKLWREDYMKMLLDIYDPKYKYTEPEAVKNSSSNYCDANNDVKRFITEHFELTNKKEDYLLLKDIKATYSCNKEYDQSKIKNFKEHIEKEMNVSVLEKSKVKKDGKWADVRSVIFGWKYREDDCEE